MTERPSPYLLMYRKPDDWQDTFLVVESSKHTLPLGQLSISLDDPDFCNGYEQGIYQYNHWHRDDLTIDAAMLLSLVRNGWGSQRYSEMWQTGYIVGWLGALFTHAHGMGGA